MIGSILQAFRSRGGADLTNIEASDSAAHGVTRQDFLKLAAAGTLVAGFGSSACAGNAAQVTKGTGLVPPVTDIDKVYDAWQDRMNRGDLEGLVDFYLEDVTYINPDGKLLYGKAAVRADFEGLLALKPQIVLGDRVHYLYQDVALTTNHWKMTFTDPDGKVQNLAGGGIEVMRKQADGGWRYIIDDASRSASK